MIKTFKIWASAWTRSQLWFLFLLNLWWFGIALWAAHRFDVARDEAIYWHQRATNLTIYNR